MSTAVMGASALDQKISTLETEAKELEVTFRKTLGEKYAELGAVYAQKAAEFGASGSMPVSAPVHHRTNGKVAVRKKPGRKGKVSPKERNYDNKVSLRQTIWDILSRGKRLRISEIKDIIESEKVWESNSENIGPQIQQHLYGLKKLKKIERNSEDHSYGVVKGATL